MGVVTFAGGKVGMDAPSGLPAGCTRLAYIQSGGTQYIDTGFKPNNNTKVIAEVQFATAPTTHSCIFGVRNANAQQFWCYYRYDGNGYVIRYASGSASDKKVSCAATDRAQITMDKNVLTVNGASVTHADGTFQATHNMYLFAANNAGSLQYPGSFKLYSCKIYDNGVLVRDFVPCISHANVVCLYDLVEGKFYTNLGPGLFIGSEVA